MCNWFVVRSPFRWCFAQKDNRYRKSVLCRSSPVFRNRPVFYEWVVPLLLSGGPLNLQHLYRLSSGSAEIPFGFLTGCFVDVPTCCCSILKPIRFALINPTVALGYLAALWSSFFEYSDSERMKVWCLNKHRNMSWRVKYVCLLPGVYSAVDKQSNEIVLLEFIYTHLTGLQHRAQHEIVIFRAQLLMLISTRSSVFLMWCLLSRFFPPKKIDSDVLFVLCAAGIGYERLVQSTISVLQCAVSFISLC